MPIDFSAILWLDKNGDPVSCIEKLKVLHEALIDLQQDAQDTLEDAVLMGCTENQIRDVLGSIVTSLSNPYGKNI